MAKHHFDGVADTTRNLGRGSEGVDAGVDLVYGNKGVVKCSRKAVSNEGTSARVGKRVQMPIPQWIGTGPEFLE